jgi:glycosyltransferase involved in cell wall biosynthesis
MTKKNQRPSIVVNATALDKSGALTILKQFLSHASQNESNHYLCFVPEGLDLKKSGNITFIEMPKMGWLSRIKWDAYKLKQYLRLNKIDHLKVISLQNTTVNVDVSQIIYLHQPLPFSDVKWSFFKKEHFKLFLYKHFYKFFILLFAKADTQFVVQTKWMKKALCEKSNIKYTNIHVIRPDIILPDMITENYSIQGGLGHRLLYPATPFFYKNHQIILEALQLLKLENKIKGLKFQVTFNSGEYSSFDNNAQKLGVLDYIEYLGVIPYSELIDKYLAASLVLFPSFVETFGLPLAEGANLKKSVLCSDLPFSRDVLHGYSGAVFLDYKDPIAWAGAIEDTLKKIENNSLECGNFEFKQSSSWKDFFKLI